MEMQLTARRVRCALRLSASDTGRSRAKLAVPHGRPKWMAMRLGQDKMSQRIATPLCVVRSSVTIGTTAPLFSWPTLKTETPASAIARDKVLLHRLHLLRPAATVLSLDIGQNASHKSIDQTVRRNGSGGKPLCHPASSLGCSVWLLFQLLVAFELVRAGFNPLPHAGEGHGMALKKETPQSCKLVIARLFIQQCCKKLSQWLICCILR